MAQAHRTLLPTQPQRWRCLARQTMRATRTARAAASMYRLIPRPLAVPTWVVGLTMTLMAAQSAAQTAVPEREVRGLWRVEQARTEPIYDREHARLDFGADGKLSGHTSCNRLTATYTLQDIQLRIGPVATTRVACGRLQLEQEDRILSALELAVTARVREDGLLELRDADGRGVLRGTRLLPGE
jgi:heat shock protein HslJ